MPDRLPQQSFLLMSVCSAGRRRAGRSGREELAEGWGGFTSGFTSCDVLGVNRSLRRLRISPVSSDDRVVAIVVTTSHIPEYGLIGRSRRTKTVMDACAAAAGTRSHTSGLERNRKDRSDKRKKQQKSCGQPLHKISQYLEPQVWLRIKQNAATRNMGPVTKLQGQECCLHARPRAFLKTMRTQAHAGGAVTGEDFRQVRRGR